MSGPLQTQAARTTMAWQRTGLSVLGVAALLARGAATQGDLRLVVPAAVVALAGLVVLGPLVSRRRTSGDLASRTAGDARSPRTAAAVTALVVLTGLCALAAELLGR